MMDGRREEGEEERGGERGGRDERAPLRRGRGRAGHELLKSRTSAGGRGKLGIKMRRVEVGRGVWGWVGGGEEEEEGEEGGR